MNAKNTKENLLDKISTSSSQPEILNNFRRPNVQFIRSAKQLSKRANELVVIFEKFRDMIKVPGLRSVSTRTGNGFFINTAFFDINNFNRDYIIEVIDFDPVRNNMMVIGNEPPAADAALHWFIYRGLPWINGVIKIENSEILGGFQNSSIPTIAPLGGVLDTNSALEILRKAKSADITVFESSGVLVIGKTLTEAYNKFNEHLTTVPAKENSKTNSGKVTIRED